MSSNPIYMRKEAPAPRAGVLSTKPYRIEEVRKDSVGDRPLAQHPAQLGELCGLGRLIGLLVSGKHTMKCSVITGTMLTSDAAFIWLGVTLNP